MVYNGKLVKMDDLGVPLFLETSTSNFDSHEQLKPLFLCALFAVPGLIFRKKQNTLRWSETKKIADFLKVP